MLVTILVSLFCTFYISWDALLNMATGIGCTSIYKYFFESFVLFYLTFWYQIALNILTSDNFERNVACNRIATAQEKRNLDVPFAIQRKHREFAQKILKICFYTGNLPFRM